MLRDKAFNIAKNPKYYGYQRRLASIVYKFFDKKTFGGTVKNKNFSNKELAEELHKPIIRKSKKRIFSPYQKNTITFHRQYLGCRSRRYAINKQI